MTKPRKFGMTRKKLLELPMCKFSEQGTDSPQLRIWPADGRRREVKTAKRIARAALAFAFGVLVAPLLPFVLAYFAGKEDE